jgi:hypothetical protein
VTAVDANSPHATVTSFTGTVNIAEVSAIPVYSQNWPDINGTDSGPPPYVTISSGGVATLVAKSIAGPKTEGVGGAAPDAAFIKTTNYPTYIEGGGASLEVPQWITSTKTDPFLSGPVYDWFYYRIRDIITNARGTRDLDLQVVLATILNYNLSGTVGGGSTLGTPGADTSVVSFVPYFSLYRLIPA